MMRTPKLRFKEFSGEWQSKKLEDITSYVDYRGKTPPKSDNGVFLVTAKNIKNGYIDYDTSKEFISEESYEDAMRRGLPKKGDVLLTTEAPLGNVAQIDREDIALAQRVIKFRGTDELDNTYLKYYFLSEKFQNKLFTKAIGTTVLGIQGKVLHKMQVSFPIIYEQEKIASFISLIDNKISLQGEKVEKLKDYKKGMMQKIFSRELRFKDDEGRDYPEWEEKRLGELFNIKAGGDIKSGNVSRVMTDKNIYPVYANALNNRGLYGYTDTFKVEGDTITVTGRGDIGYAIARSERYYPIVRLLVLSPIIEVNTIYFENVINFTNIFVESTGVPQLTSPQLSQVKVNVPEFEEQNKISKLLKCIDTKIKKEKEKLDYLNEYKKGLLQQMFV